MLELVTYWDPCKEVSYRLEIYALKERRLLQDQVQLSIKVKVQLHANREGTNKSLNKLNAAENKLTGLFVDKWGKPLARQKPHGMIDFKVATSKNLLTKNQAVTSIRNLTNYSGLS